MPINKTIKVNNQRQIAIWKITETTDQLFSQLNPSEEDVNLLHSFKNENKKQEWLAGRLTLKFLCDELGLTYTGVSKDQFGKPSLKTHAHEISISHSHPYVAAVIDPENEVGIDLEQPRAKVIRISEKFCNASELEYAGEDILTLNFIWCAKETMYKIYSRKKLIFKDSLYVESFNPATDDQTIGNIIVNGTKEKYNLALENHKEFILCYNL